MTATVRAVINDAVANAGCGDRNLYGLVTDTVLAALAEAGLAVAPADDVQTQWGYGPDGQQWIAGSRTHAEVQAAGRPGEGPWRRTAHYGPWEPVPDAG